LGGFLEEGKDIPVLTLLSGVDQTKQFGPLLHLYKARTRTFSAWRPR
jgi:hypothetical protein